MKLFRLALAAMLLLWLSGAGARAGAAVSQFGLVIDTANTMRGDDEQPAKDAITAALSKLAVDGSVEVAVVQFSGTAAAVSEPTVIASAADLDALIGAVQGIDPTDTDFGLVQGRSNFEAAFELITALLTGSDEFATREFALVNFLSDGNPATHNHLGAPDNDPATRLQRSRDFGKQARDAAVAAGIDVIGFALIDPPTGEAGGLPYVQTLAYPGSPPFDAPPYPDPITSGGFIVEPADVGGIAQALTGTIIAADLPTPATLALMVFGGAVLIPRRGRVLPF